MPKKPKEPKVDSPVTTPTSTAAAVEEKKQVKEKEVLVVQDSAIFYYDTGDVYEGEFEAKKKDMSVKMHGLGKYTTNEGDTYEGNWQYNTLVGVNSDVTITYKDGSKYKGQFKNWCYNGPGSYIYPDEAEIRGDFLDNCPVGNFVLEDPNGKNWLGKAQQGFCWFGPVNHYYEDLKNRKALVNRQTKHLSSNRSSF